MSMSEQPDLHRLHTDLEVLRERVSGLEQGRFEALEAKLDAARAEWQGFRGEFDAKLDLVRAEGQATRDEFSAKLDLVRAEGQATRDAFSAKLELVKADTQSLRREMEAGFTASRREMDDFKAEFSRNQQRTTVILSVIGAILTILQLIQFFR